MSNTRNRAAAAAHPGVDKPISYESFLEKLTPKDRLNADRHIATCEAEPDSRHAVLWRRLMCMLATLATHSVKLNGRQSAQFYVADGKYRMQVFALEDLCDGNVNLYCGDVIKEAKAAGILRDPRGGGANDKQFVVQGATETLTIEALNGQTV